MAAATEKPLEVRAQAKWVRTSPRKARLVAEHIRGRSVLEARSVLAFTQRDAARELEKVLRSAVANAESKHQIADENLYVYSAYVDEGPTMKRWRARARGRVARIRKRTCHITITLAEISTTAAASPPKQDAKPKPEAAEKPKRKARAKKKEGAAA